MNVKTLLIAAIYYCIVSISIAYAKDLYPQRPTYKRHLELVQGTEKTPIELYHYSRVGWCANKPFHSNHKILTEEQSWRQLLNCSHTDIPVPEQSKYSLQRDLKQAVDFRSTRSLWQVAQAQDLHLEAHHLAKRLLSSHHPTRTLERIKLSYASQLLQALDFGPNLVNTTAHAALTILKSLSVDALGVQVRALALKALNRWHYNIKEQDHANRELWINYPQTPTTSAPPFCSINTSCA